MIKELKEKAEKEAMKKEAENQIVIS